MTYVLTLKQGHLQVPTELLEELGVGPDDQVSIRTQKDALVIGRVDEQAALEEPVFQTEEPAPLKLGNILKEVGPGYISEAYSDAGLLTRDEFNTILHEYEEHFGLSSSEFYEKWQAGKLPDKPEFTFWAHMYEESLDKRIVFKDEAPLEDIVGYPPQ